jgi:hypothetical protein
MYFVGLEIKKEWLWDCEGGAAKLARGRLAFYESFLLNALKK